MGKRIVIMAGGTGGHVFPALAVAHYLQEQDWQVSWMGTLNGLESKVVPANGIEIDWLPVAGFRGKGLAAKFKAVGLLIRACFAAGKILRQRKPDVVLGMGGFVAGPGGLMAKLQGIPLIIHEQNRVPGTTNRLLAKLANQVLEAFPGSFKKNVNAKWVGNPLRKELLSATQKMAAKSAGAVHILILGGSQGAKVLNEIMPDTALRLESVKIKHQTGESMLAEVTQRYQDLGIDAQVTAFIQNMAEAYQWADLVVCRSGAMTVSEVAAMALPAVYIPFPYAIDDHQTANAKYAVDAGGGLLLMQQDLNTENLADRINHIIGHLDEMGPAALTCAKLDATRCVADSCIAEARP